MVTLFALQIIVQGFGQCVCKAHETQRAVTSTWYYASMATMKTIGIGDSGPAVEDVQQRLATIGLLPGDAIDGTFGEETAAAVRAFRSRNGLEAGDGIDEKT